MSDDDSVTDNLARNTRIEARQFARVFATPDGAAVLAGLKRDFGWDAATPPIGPDGEIPISRLRAWTGARSVIGTILHKISLGEKLSNKETTTNNDNDE